jgi:hypothetical protein
MEFVLHPLEPIRTSIFVNLIINVPEKGAVLSIRLPFGIETVPGAFRYSNEYAHGNQCHGRRTISNLYV